VGRGTARALRRDGTRPEQVHSARIAFRLDGTIVAIENAFKADVGAYPVEGTGLTLNTVNHLPGPYRVPTTGASARAT
jgi:CO/xanthine dehydrogenase Mo-binding subunit